MNADDRGRVIVGVDGSEESLSALRKAAEQARCRHTELLVVNARPGLRAWIPILYRVGDGVAFMRRARHGRAADGGGRSCDLIADCLHEAVGGEPDGLTIRRFMPVGRPEKALLELAWRHDDLLVVGSRGGRRRRHPTRRSISRYCAGHARCPLLVVTAERPTSSSVHQSPAASAPTSGFARVA